MAKDGTELGKFENFTIIVFVLALIFCSMHVVPGWGIFDLDWHPGVHYAIMCAAGALCGFAVAKYKVFGAGCGIISGIGAMYACQFILERVNKMPSKALVLIALVGILPGFLLYLGLAYFLNKQNEKVDSGVPTDPVDEDFQKPQ